MHLPYYLLQLVDLAVIIALTPAHVKCFLGKLAGTGPGTNAARSLQHHPYESNGVDSDQQAIIGQHAKGTPTIRTPSVYGTT
jgi:hypothetical protein